MADDTESAPTEADQSPDAAFHLRLGSGTIEAPLGRIVALTGENGSGLHELFDAVTRHIVRDEQSSARAKRRRGLEHGAAVVGTGVRASGSLVAESRVTVIARRPGLSPTFDIAENVFLGEVQRRMLGPIPIGIAWGEMRARTAALLAQLGSTLGPTDRARDLGELERLLVELARTIQRDCALLVIDEPTALLGAEEPATLIRALRVLRDRGVAVLVLTQKPREAMGYADTLVVARDGTTVAVHRRAEWEAAGVEAVRADILREMVDRPSNGGETTPRRPARAPDGASELLRVAGWTTHDPIDPQIRAVDDADLVVADGEVVGIAGLARSGSETLLLSVHGRSAGTATTGSVFVRGALVDTSTVDKSIAAGLFFAATDAPRYRMRLLGGITLPVAPGRMPGFARAGMIDVEEGPSNGLGSTILGAVRSAGRDGDATTRIRGLVQAFADSERLVLLLGEPFRGSDAAERAEIVAGITRATAAGKGVVIVSDDLESLRSICDRIVVMAKGRVTGTVPAATPAVDIAPLLAPD